jgi:hypothetical protein
VTNAATATTFVLSAKLPWLDGGATMPDGDDPLEPTHLRVGGAALESEIREISPLGATLRGAVDVCLGAGLAMELGSGQRVDAIVAWRGEQDVGVRFTRPVDVMALITRQLVSQPVERRTMPRVEVRVSAWLRDHERFVPIAIRNISAGGLQVEGAELPPTGEAIHVFAEGLGIPAGEVIWKRGELAGVRFDRELSWQALLPWIKDLHRPKRG